MKIGIVTWYKNGNFGGTLQAFALNSVLKNMGYEVEFINYCNKGIINLFIKRVKKIAFLILYPIEYFSVKKILKFVNKNLNQSISIYNYSDLIRYSKKYDYVICGSDQIWSTVGGFDKYYFLDFVEEEKRVSYAPSIGYNDIPKDYVDDFKKYVSNIPHLSVREEKGREIIKSICKKDAMVVLDPSLLLDKNYWKNVAKLSRKKVRKKFILCYFLSNNKDYFDYAKKLKNETGYDLIFISTKKLKILDFKYKKICGVEDFVYYVSNAEYVLTDSFHGLAFSINFNKKFGVFKRFNDDSKISQNSRIYNLLSLTDFSNYILDPNGDVKILLKMEYNYKIAETNLNSERAKSLKFLSESLK